MFPGGIGFQELIVIGVVAVLLFGSRLPNVARSIGQTYQQFRKGLSELHATMHVDTEPDNGYSAGTNVGLPDYTDVDDDYLEPTGTRFEPPADDDDA